VRCIATAIFLLQPRVHADGKAIAIFRYFVIIITIYLYFAVGLFLNKKTRIIDVLGVIFFLNKAIKVY
jgi:hypothetical protein